MVAFGLRVSQAPRVRDAGPARFKKLGAVMDDLLVVGITVVIFAALFLLVRVVEHLER
jgi:hypothetical protein